MSPKADPPAAVGRPEIPTPIGGRESAASRVNLDFSAGAPETAGGAPALPKQPQPRAYSPDVRSRKSGFLAAFQSAARVIALLGAYLFLSTAIAQNAPERTRLYTKPDPANTGGLKGRVSKPELPIEEILALPADSPEEVYQGEITGPKRDAFEFKGLPVGKYDLIVIYPAAFYEGLQLNRDASTLTLEDLKKIDTTIQKSEPFFTKKVIHRVEGVTGRASGARGICTYFREKGSDLLMEQFEGKSSRDDFRRTFKLVLLKDVGPGWQIVRARDLYPVWVNPKRSLPEHHFSATLSQFRVADALKDLGDLDLH